MSGANWLCLCFICQGDIHGHEGPYHGAHGDGPSLRSPDHSQLSAERHQWCEGTALMLWVKVNLTSRV